jgi:sterol desaturase/sphingolipid hydroxylase (fatty acid hydroxylase superfamily)
MRESLLVSFILRVLFLVSLILLMVPLERIWAVSRRRFFREGMFTDVLHFFANPIGVRHALAAALVGAEVALAAVVPVGWREFFGGMHIGAQFGCVLFAGEFLSYWTHRASHSWTWLWRFHAIHHSSKGVDWLSGHRQHPLDTLLFLTAANLPVVALGFSAPFVAAVAVFHRTFVTFTHARTRLVLRRLRWLVVTPRYHHRHHDRDAPAANFAGLLPVFDLLFGTYRWPDALPPAYGVRHDVSTNWVGQLVLPFFKDPEAEVATPRLS